MTNRIITGPSITLGETIYEIPDVFEQVAQNLIEDTEEPNEVNEQMVEFYAAANIEQRGAIDEFMAAYCGFSFKTTLSQAGATPELLKAMGIDPEEVKPPADEPAAESTDSDDDDLDDEE